jgi:hypothetical protein
MNGSEFPQRKLVLPPIPSARISCFARVIAQPGGIVLSLGKAMRRRDFIKAIVGSTAVWPVAARAQPDRAGQRRQQQRHKAETGITGTTDARS